MNFFLNLLLLINFPISYSFIHRFTKSKISKCSILEPSNPLDANISLMFLPPQINNNYISYSYYSDFLNHNVNNNMKIYIPNDNNLDSIIELSKQITDCENLIILSHSNSANQAINICNSNKDINTLIMIDPIKNSPNVPDFISDYFNNSIINSISSINIPSINILSDDIINLYKNFTNNIPRITYIQNKKDDKVLNVSNLLIINNEKTYKWIYSIPLIPPIGLFKLNISDVSQTVIVYEDILDHGHFDILDTTWSNLLHNLLSKGTNDRGIMNLIKYRKDLSDIIYEFVN